MNLLDIKKFLGLPAQSKDFDEYLTSHGITYRPVFTETPIDDINAAKKGVSLIFYTARTHQEFYGPVREPGSMIFSAVQVYGEANDSDFQQYAGPLPYDLSFKAMLVQVKNILGEPTIEHPAGDGRTCVWYDHHGETIGITFLPDDQGISFLELTRVAKEPPEPMDWD